ncbi:MAG: aminoacyl-tRNA hydrolase, partial [Actinomycetales bacterium]|nr:aminoacyl-tRNA hydrolase [Actinomycetales bacterium]
KARLQEALGRRLVGEGKALIVRSSARRSQHQNMEVCRERLAGLIADGLLIRKARRATKPTRGSQRRRLDKKRARGQIKRDRRSGGSDD